MVSFAENSELSKNSETRMTASVLKQGPNNHKRLKTKQTKNRCLLGQFPVVLCSNKQCSFEPSMCLDLVKTFVMLGAGLK